MDGWVCIFAIPYEDSMLTLQDEDEQVILRGHTSLVARDQARGVSAFHLRRPLVWVHHP